MRLCGHLRKPLGAHFPDFGRRVSCAAPRGGNTGYDCVISSPGEQTFDSSPDRLLRGHCLQRPGPGSGPPESHRLTGPRPGDEAAAAGEPQSSGHGFGGARVDRPAGRGDGFAHCSLPKAGI